MRRPVVESAVPYEVSCWCGQSLRGMRQRSRQIVSCPSCGRKRFILPSSPWQAPADAASGPTALLNLRCLLVAILVGGALAMGLSFLLVRPYLRRPGTPADGEKATDARALLEAGEHQLRDGNVHLAVKELNAAVAQAARHPDALNREEHHRLEQLRRQTDLLSRLLDQPLAEIVRQAMQHRSDDEWRAKFADYHGRTVVFEDVLRRDAHDRPALLVYDVSDLVGVKVRIALEDLVLLRQLPLDPPRRWLFGAQLASCRREEGGIWVVRFEPDSTVLLTDENAAAACCKLPLEQELLGVLKRQDEWLRQ